MSVSLISIIGSGQMGRGIAQVAIQKGYQVYLYDVAKDALGLAREFIEQQLLKGVSKNKWDKASVDKALSLLHLKTEILELVDSDFVIEAATENKNIKFQIFKQLDEVMQPKAILASNTSSISITELAAQTGRASQVVGMHFMNPVPVMKLVEGIRGLETSDETFKATQDFAQNLGKTFVTAKDMPGFAVNRILMPMINEAIYAHFEGVASIEDIDQAMKLGTNQPMGPLELADFIGLDTCLAIMNVLFEGFGDTKYRPCPLLKQYVAAGRLGRKNKKGFYTYEQ